MGDARRVWHMVVFGGSTSPYTAALSLAICARKLMLALQRTKSMLTSLPRMFLQSLMKVQSDHLFLKRASM
jgi:hypothetical protein